MRTKTKFLLTSIVTGVIGAVYTFADYKVLKNTLKLGFGLRHNDHVMIGIIGLTVAVVSLYAFFARKE